MRAERHAARMDTDVPHSSSSTRRALAMGSVYVSALAAIDAWPVNPHRLLDWLWFAQALPIQDEPSEST